MNIINVNDKIQTPFGELICTKILEPHPIIGEQYILDGARHLELYRLELLNNLDLWGVRL